MGILLAASGSCTLGAIPIPAKVEVHAGLQDDSGGVRLRCVTNCEETAGLYTMRERLDPSPLNVLNGTCCAAG